MKAIGYFWKGTKLGVSRVFLFWKGGIYSYIGISLVPVGENWSAISRVLQEWSWNAVGGVFTSFGLNVAVALQEAGEAAAQLPTAGGITTVSVFGVGVPMFEAVVLLGTVVLSVVTIGWYFRMMHLGVKALGGENVPPVLSFLIGALVYALLVWGATGVLPVEASVDLVQDVRVWVDSVYGGGAPVDAAELVNETDVVNGSGGFNSSVK